MNFELVTENNMDYLRQESSPFDFENPPCDADDLANGIYLIRAFVNGSIITKKVSIHK